MISTILGIVITFILGVMGIIFTLKTVNRTSITFVQYRMLSLFRTIVQDMKNISIKYKEDPIDHGLFLYQFALHNDGNLDIDRSVIVDDVCIRFPDDFKILEFSIDQSPIKATINQNENSLYISWHLFKKNEFLPISVLLHINPENYKEDFSLEALKSFKNVNDVLFQKISITTRIKNLSSINKIDSDEYKLKFSKNNRKSIILTGVILFLAITTIVFSALEFKKSQIGFKYQSNGQNYDVKIDTNYSEKILVKEICWNTFNDKVLEKTIPEKFDIGKIKSIMLYRDILSILPIFMSALLLLFVIFNPLQGLYRDYKIKKKYGKLVDIFK